MLDKAGGGLPPLVVDLDGTLTRTDTLFESIFQLLKHDVTLVARFPLWLLRGRAAFKERVASHAPFSAAALPYRLELVDYLRAQRQNGRRLVLATASHRSVAAAVAAHLGLFDDVIASDGVPNCKGHAKLQAIREKIGQRFVYAGDSMFDVPIWRAANAAILAGVAPRIAKIVRQSIPIEMEMARNSPRPRVWLHALRTHQWLKNLLVFVPLLTAFAFEQTRVVSAVLAFFAFSLAASSAYVFNDLIDLEADRAHPRKRHRPFAAGDLSAATGIGIAVAALAAGAALAFTVSRAFALLLLFYVALTTLYSVVLKKRVLIDVLALSVLYTTRIVGGAIATSIVISSWLLAFSGFLFVSLALLKRCSELVSMSSLGRDSTHGRDYRVTDLTVLWPLGVGTGLSAVVVFGLFVNAPETQARYLSPSLLWLVALALIYWLARVWIKAARREMHDDPIVFAMQDVGSRLTLAVMIGVVLIAKFLALPVL